MDISIVIRILSIVIGIILSVYISVIKKLSIKRKIYIVLATALLIGISVADNIIERNNSIRIKEISDSEIKANNYYRQREERKDLKTEGFAEQYVLSLGSSPIAQHHFNNADKYEKENNYREAINEYLECIINPLSKPNLETIGYIYIGNCYVKLFLLSDAQEAYRSAWEISNNIENNKDRLKIEALLRFNESTVYIQLDNLNKALANLKKAIKYHRNVKDEKAIAKDANLLGLVYRDMGDINKAFDFLNEAMILNRKNNEEHNLANNLTNLGTVYREIGKNPEALESYKKALEIDIKLKDDIGKAIDLSNIGLLTNDVSLINESLVIFKSVGDNRNVVNHLNNIGNIIRDKGEIKEAKKLHLEGLQLSRDIKYLKGEAVHLGNLGIIAAYESKDDEAVSLFKASIDIYREISYKKGMAEQSGNIGLNYQNRKKYEESLFYLNISLKYYTEIQNRKGIADQLLNIGQVYLEMSDLSKANRYIKNALNIHLQINDKLGIIADTANLGHVYYDSGKKEKGLEYLNNAIKMAKEEKLGYFIDLIEKEIQEITKVQK